MIKSPNPFAATKAVEQHNELYVFLNALMFLMSIPVPKNLPYTDDRQHQSMRYQSFIGWIVGSIGAAVFYGLHFVFTPGLSILLTMLATILMTGALHEDGFSDCCDVFGGGNIRKIVCVPFSKSLRWSSISDLSFFRTFTYETHSSAAHFG